MNIRARLQHIMRNPNGHPLGESPQKAGIAFLLMVVLLAAFLSIAMGIINILLGQIFIVGQAGESFEAFYASDIGMERTLYRDRVQGLCMSGCVESRTLPDNSCYISTLITGPSAACPAPNTRCIIVKGKNKCNGQRFVERDFDIKY